MKLFKNLSTFVCLPIITLFLMGAALPTVYSDVYGKNYSEIKSVLASKVENAEIKSDRDSVMATYKLTYEVFKMNSWFMITNPKQGYTVNYRLEVQLKTNCKYASGLFNWFTSTGNPIYKRTKVTIRVNSPASDFVEVYRSERPFTISNRIDNAVFVKPRPGNNVTAHSPTGTFYINETTVYPFSEAWGQFDLDEVMEEDRYRFNYDQHASKNNTSYECYSNYAYLNTLTGNEYLPFYGSLTFASDTLPSSLDLSIISEMKLSKDYTFAKNYNIALK